MHRTEGDGFVVVGGKNQFTEGDPLIPTPATQLTYDWCNAVQEELALTIEGLGGTLNTAGTDGTPNQLLTRLNAKYGRLDLANTWAALNTFNAGVTLGAGSNLSVGGTLDATGNTTLSADLTVDTSTLKVDSTKNRVGVGTAAPNALLSVGTAGVVDSQLPVQVSAGSTTSAFFAANKGASYGALFGYSNGSALGTGGVVRVVNDEPIYLIVNSTVTVAEVVGVGINGIKLTSAPPSSTTAVQNTLTAANIVKAHGHIIINGGTATLDGGSNVESVAISGTDLVISFAQDFLNTTYSFVCWDDNAHGLQRITKAVGSMTLRKIDSAARTTISFATGAHQVDFFASGLQ